MPKKKPSETTHPPTEIVSVCKEYWEIPYHSEHLFQGDHHNLPSGNCQKCGKSYFEYNKQANEFIKSGTTPTHSPTEIMKKIIDKVNTAHSEEVKKVEATCPCPDCRKKRMSTEKRD